MCVKEKQSKKSKQNSYLFMFLRFNLRLTFLVVQYEKRGIRSTTSKTP